MSIYEDKYWRRIVGGSGCRTILTNHEDNTLARTIRSILVSRVHNHVTWILYTQALLLFLPCLWLRIATCYLLLYRSSSSSLSSFSTLYNWHTIVRMRIRIDDMPLCTRYESTYEIRIDAPCPERSPRNFSMPHINSINNFPRITKTIYIRNEFSKRKKFSIACAPMFDPVIQSINFSRSDIIRLYWYVKSLKIVSKNELKRRSGKNLIRLFTITLSLFEISPSILPILPSLCCETRT